jgi:hypothetical protein
VSLGNVFLLIVSDPLYDDGGHNNTRGTHMGLLDSLFGGGTKLDLRLDTTSIPEGGTLSGTVTLSGGKKPLTITAIQVKLAYVQVTSVPGSSMPKIDMKYLLDNTIVSNMSLPPASLQKHDFSFAVPKGTDPKGTYKVIASADIPGVKDPSANVDLKVIAAYAGSGGPGGLLGLVMGDKHSEEQVLGQFPKLMSADEDDLCDGLHELQCEAYSADNNFVKIEGFLSKKMSSGSVRVRESALAAWSVVMNNRAKPEHIKTLEALVDRRDNSSEMMRQVVVAAARLAEEGGLPLVRRLMKHENPDVRAHMATHLWLDADDALTEKKDLLKELTTDTDVSVRAAAYKAMSTFSSDAAIMKSVAATSFSDVSPDVQRACVAAMSLAHHHGMADLVLDTYVKHTKNPHSAVRMELADCTHWLPVDARTTHIVGALLTDTNVEVRRKAAWQCCNMSDHPELTSLYTDALRDSDDEVRANVVSGAARMMPSGYALALARRHLQSDPTEKMGWACYNLAAYNEEPGYADFLKELTKAPFASVAQAARERLSNGS